jgi:hypothetical protein
VPVLLFLLLLVVSAGVFFEIALIGVLSRIADAALATPTLQPGEVVAVRYGETEGLVRVAEVTPSGTAVLEGMGDDEVEDAA